MTNTIDEILDEIHIFWALKLAHSYKDNCVAQRRASLIDYINREVIGKNEQHQFWCNGGGDSSCDCGATVSNNLRKEQRAVLTKERNK